MNQTLTGSSVPSGSRRGKPQAGATRTKPDAYLRGASDVGSRGLVQSRPGKKTNQKRKTGKEKKKKSRTADQSALVELVALSGIVRCRKFRKGQLNSGDTAHCTEYILLLRTSY